MTTPQGSIAYFSMEIALDPRFPTYSGGLGILAGDSLRAAADIRVPMVGVTLLHRLGYFSQKIDTTGWQAESAETWPYSETLKEVRRRVSVPVAGQQVAIRAWEYQVEGQTGFVVPVYLLDTNLPENGEWERTLTDCLYGGDARYRLAQEIVLGIGGVRMLRALGYERLSRYHMNEGHASLLSLELLRENALRSAHRMFTHKDVEEVKSQCVFTTHTPVAAGHDQFPLSLAQQLLGPPELFEMKEVFCCHGVLNMTYLALNLSRYVNGVAKRHGEVSRQILTPRDAQHRYEIDAITNGVHLGTWAAPSFASLFDRFIPGWNEDNSSMRYVLRIPGEDIWQAHLTAKQALIAEVNRRTNAGFDVPTLTLGFARRATAYKRANLLLTDPVRLKSIAAGKGRLQVVYAGKAHPHDDPGKRIIQEIVALKDSLQPEIKIVYLENYDWNLARLVIPGVDVWLNTPQPPLEASGTSGMKAALNGVPSLSLLDGWWIEGCIEGVTGWAVGPPGGGGAHSDADSLYQKLEQVIIPCFYHERDLFIQIMRQAIALNASHFNTQRMLQEYVLKAYFK